MPKMELASMTWREAEEAFRRNPVILIPMGSIEQHGPHVPVGDYRYAALLARRIAEQTGAIATPTIPWGYSEDFRPFPGTLSLRPETLTLLLQDVCDGFIRFGLDHLLFVCCHNGNMPLIEQVARRLRQVYRLRTAAIEPWSWFTPGFKQDAYGDERAATGHGSDPMGSLAMAVFPDEVRLDLREAAPPPVFAGLSFQSSSRAMFEGVPVHLYLDFDELTVNGVVGDPTLSDAAVGQKLLDRVVEIGCKFVRKFAGMPTRIEERNAGGGRGPQRVDA